MYTGTSRAASPELETRVRHRGLMSEQSADSCADLAWDAAGELQIIDERRGGVLTLGGVKQDTNIVWVAPAPDRALAPAPEDNSTLERPQSPTFHEQIFDMLFLNKYQKKKLQKSGYETFESNTVREFEDPDKIERLDSARTTSDESPGVKTLSMILREAGFDVPDHEDSASLDVDMGDFSSVCDNSSDFWLSYYHKRSQRIICRQFLVLSPLLFLLLYLPSSVLVLMFYCSDMETFR